MSPQQRRRSNRGRQGGDGRSARNNGSGSANAKGRGKAQRNQRARPARSSVDAFWGTPDAAGDSEGQSRTVERIRPTTDPGALPRSLGEPPLTPDTAASHHLAVVYEEAVRAATALAVANGLLDDPDAALDAPADGSD